MATVILNLPVDEGIAERIKKYAHSRKTSVSRITESFFVMVTSAAKNKKKEISPLVKSFSIDGVSVSADFDYKKELVDARTEKYL
jgi:hypothetical protein